MFVYEIFMNLFDDRILQTKTRIKAYVVATDIKRGTTSTGSTFTYFNGKLKTGNTYVDKLTNELRPSYFWVPVVTYGNISDQLFSDLKVTDLVYITNGYIDAFRGDNGEQKGIRIIVDNYRILTQAEANSDEVKEVKVATAAVINPFTGDTTTLPVQVPQTIEEILSEAGKYQKCLFFKRSDNRIDLINERANSMSFVLKKRNGDLFYRVYPYNKTDKSDPMKKICSHSFCNIRTIDDAKLLLDIFIQCATLSNR